MKRVLFYSVATLVLTAFALGCGGDKDKGINRGKDIPKPPEAEAKDVR
jgi:hypothetical protein